MLKQLRNFIGKTPDQCDESNVCLQLTGVPPTNPAEEMVKRIVGERQSVPLRWLEEELSHSLYREELGHNAWAADIGIWGPAGFGPEVARILSEVRPEFVRIDTEGLAEEPGETSGSFAGKVTSGKPLYGDC